MRKNKPQTNTVSADKTQIKSNLICFQISVNPKNQCLSPVYLLIFQQSFFADDKRRNHAAAARNVGEFA